ncbi:hypothetical protein F2Q69_00041177 [Brassica cretica]|uniref:NADP-dependent oxidoreductase domain-containing protein n=1 Tax=Brassica cretica TaxID=69181 RepID=A0A8S9NJV0_BRACR|nr:hypothetical protein F2Q69_00041177 [Brassica cretica]
MGPVQLFRVYGVKPGPVSAQGLGCLGLSSFHGDPERETDAITLLHHAVDSGVTFFDTSDIYGPETNEFILSRMGELKKLVEEGKIKYIGLSEASASTIRRAHSVHPITRSADRMVFVVERRRRKYNPNLQSQRDRKKEVCDQNPWRKLAL